MASWSRPTSSTSTSRCAFCSGTRFYDDWQNSETFVDNRSAGQSGRSTASLESDDYSASAKARLRRQILLGHVSALARQAHGRPSRARHRRRRRSLGCGRRRFAGLVDVGYVKATGNSVKIYLPKTALEGGEGIRVEDSEMEQRDRARSRAHVLSGLLRGARLSLHRESVGRSCRRAAPRPGPISRCRTRRSAAAFTKRCAACSRTISSSASGKIANYHPYPPTPWNATPRDIYGTPGPYEDAVQNTPIFEENGRDNFKGIDIMRAVRSFDPCLPCGVHMYVGAGKTLETIHSPMFGVSRGRFYELC